MAETVDLSGNSPFGLDNKLSHPNRSNAGSPEGSLTPLYPGELVLDTTNFRVWRGYGTGTDGWQPVYQEA